MLLRRTAARLIALGLSCGVTHPEREWSAASMSRLPGEYYVCPVCGYPELDEPAVDAYGCASFDICSCCGTQFGYHDATRPHAQLRAEWLQAGARWRSRARQPPPDWSASRQLAAAGLCSPETNDPGDCPGGEPG